MKRYATTVIGAILGVLATGCTMPVEPQQQSETAEATLTDIISVRQPDGTYKQTIQKVTAAERKAQVERRLERMRLHKEGILPQAAEIGPDSSCDGTSLWLYNQPNPDWFSASSRCCVYGDGNDYIQYLCGGGFGQVRALWPGESGGLYGKTDPDPMYNCGSSFDGWGAQEPYPYCPYISWVQLDF